MVGEGLQKISCLQIEKQRPFIKEKLKNNLRHLMPFMWGNERQWRVNYDKSLESGIGENDGGDH